MTGSPFAPGSQTTSSKTSPFAPHAGSSGSHGVGGFIDNLGSDIKNAVVGLPMGLVNTVEHPLETVKQFGTTTWHDWSPLFHGQFGKFAHQTFDHPLAPLLDVMTVFTLGAGAAAKTAEVLTAGERLSALAAGEAPTSITEKLAALKQPKGIARVNPTGDGRVIPDRQLSTRAGRRLMQEGTQKALVASADHLPKWFVNPVKEANFNRAFVSDTAHRHLAAMTQYAAAIKAGKTVSGTTPEDIAGRANVLAAMHQNMLLRAPHRAATAAEVPAGYGVVKASEYLDPMARRVMVKAQRSASRWDKIRATHAESAHSVESLRTQLETANETLRKMHADGVQQRGIPQGMPGWDKPNPTAKQLMNGLAAPRKEAEANVARLTKALENARVSKTIHNKALDQLDQLGQHIHGYNNRVYGDYFNHHAQDYTHFQNYLGNFAKHTVISGTTKRALGKMETMGARDAQGNLILVPMHTAKALGQEGANSSAFVKLIYHNPAMIWKKLQVGFTPRTIVNNGVGNWMLYLTRTDPISAFKGIRAAARYAKGDYAAMEMDNMVKGATSVGSHWMNQFKHELGQDVSGASHEHVVPQKGGGYRIDTALKSKLGEGVYPLVHKFSDAPVRRAALASFMHSDRGVTQLAKQYKAAGMSGGEAFDKAVMARLTKDPALYDRATQYSRSVSGDYASLNAMEKHVRNIAPFYLWDKHIVKTGFNITAETPGRVAFMQSMSNQGVQKSEAILGALPDFLKGAVPLSSLGLGGIFGGNSRSGVLSTTGLNPFNTIGDLAETAKAGITGGGNNPGEALFGNMFPAVAGAISWASGKNLLTGTPIKNPGAPLPFILDQTTASLPFMRIIKSAVNPNPSTTTAKGNQTMYAKNASETLSSILGVPIKEVNLNAANAVAAKQGVKSTKKKSPFARPTA